MSEPRHPEGGMVVTSHPLAVEAGTRVLAAGGSAVDAAVAAAAVLTVADPRSTGLGGDLFALVWPAGASAPVGLEAAGPGPALLDLEIVRGAGFERMPRSGPWSVTVPGAPAGWTALLESFGRIPVAEVLEPAITAAEQGFDVTPGVAEEWLSAVDKLRADAAAAELFLPGDRAPAAGERFANPDLGATLRRFVAEGSEPFYRGDIAERIAAAVEARGGVLRAGDLAEWEGPSWVEPISVPFRDTRVFEMPPPGQGVVALESLAIYDGFESTGGPLDDHRAIESLKRSIDDAAAVVADPRFTPSRAGELLSEAHLAARRASIGELAEAARSAGIATDTVYIAVVDRDGNACSLIQSVYEGFGSGVGVPGTGLVLQNRASGFTVEDGHPNRPEPRKRPFHTIIPAMIGRRGGFAGCLGVVGGYMQPQGQLQVLRNVLDRGMTAQQAVDAPRFRSYDGLAVHLEAGFPADVAADLAARGHEIHPLPRFECGGAQLILRDGARLDGGSDSRKDGMVGRESVA